jgi:AraC-like DNA-binding protein
MALETPLLDPEVLKHFMELLDLSAQLIGGGDTARIWKKVDSLRPLFGRHLSHVYWVDWAIGQEKFYFTPEHGESLSEWEREELGITRFPTTVIAAMPIDRDLKTDPLDGLVTVAILQRKAVLIAHSFPETVGHSLKDYGVIFLTSADPHKNATQARLEIRDRAREITENLSKRLKVKVAIGVGNPSPRGGPLAASYQQAVSALHLCVQMGRPIMFFNEAPVSAVGGAVAMKQQAVKLVEAYLRGSKSTFRVARERYLEQALLSSFGVLDVLRTQLMSALADLLEAFHRRHAPDEEAYASLASTMESRLKVPLGIHALSGAFRDALESFLAYGDRPRGARAHVKMEHAQRFVDGHFSEPLILADIARRFNLSVSTFHRSFRKLTGRTFGAYLTGKRIEEAKRLLKTTSLPLEQVAQACGFNSASYFIQSFRKALRVTPGQYRGNRN